MKKIFLFCCFIGSMPSSVTPQCLITVNAGADITLCSPPETVNLNGSIDGSYRDFFWTPSSPLAFPNSLESPVNVSQTTSFVLTVQTDELGDNLIVNPDFEQGNTGFTSDFQYSPGNLVSYNVYDVLTNPQSANDALVSCSDHTSGSGNMLAATYSYNSGAPSLWCQTVPVTPHTDYYYSFWGARLGNYGAASGLILHINNEMMWPWMAFINPPFLCNWVNIDGIWNSGNNNTAHLCIRNIKTANAVAIDDIFFAPYCAEKDTVTIFVENVKASASPLFYTIPCEGFETTLSGAGSSTGPNITYQWDTPDGNIVSGQNTLYPVVNAPGTYILTVSRQNAIGDCVKTATVEVLTAPALEALISAPSTFNCYSPNVSLTGIANQPGTLAYQWTAGQGGNIVSGGNNATALVNQPGEYSLLVTNTATGCTAEASVSISAPAQPSVSIQAPGLLQGNSDTLTLSAMASPANAILIWTTPNGNIAAGATTLNPTITAPGTYILTATDPATGCKTVDSVVVEKIVVSQCPIIVDAGEDINVCGPLQDVQLNGTILGDYLEFGWAPASDFDQPNVLSPTVSVLQSKSFVLTARALNVNENLIINGDFEQGNTGFISQFGYSPYNLVPTGKYDVLPNPESANDAFAPCNDHTSGNGNMMAVNANVYPLNVWHQTVGVTPYTDYKFSFWATTLMGEPREIETWIGINPVPATSVWTMPEGCEWGNCVVEFNSGPYTSVGIYIKTFKMPNFIYFPFAFALDDIALNPVCEVKDTVKVNVVDVVANALPVTYNIPCAGNNVTLHGTGSSTGPNITYNWETQDGNIVLGQNTLHPVVNKPGTYTLTVSMENAIGDCTKSVNVEVIENNPLQVSISAPPSLNCASNTVLTGQSNLPPNASATYQWTTGTGGNIVSGANTAVALVNQPGLYNLLVTNNITGCTAGTSVSVAAPHFPSVAATATPITCASQQATLSGSGSSTGPNFAYAWSTANGNIVSGQDSLFALADTQGVYVLAVTNLLTNCSATDTVTVTTSNSLPQVNVQTADTITCLQNTVTLQTDSATAGAHFVYAWAASSGGNIVSGADSLSPVVNAPGLYILSVTDTLNACTGTDSVWVTADTAAVIAVANAGGTLTCSNLSVTLDANGSSMAPFLIYQWSTSNGSIMSGADSPTPVVNAPGEYQLLLTNPLSGCTASDVVEVAQNIAPPQVTLLPHPSLSCALPLLVLQGQNAAAASGNFSYTWTAENGGHIVAGDSTLTLCVDASGTYTLLATDLDNGCTTVANTTVTADFAAPEAELSVSGPLNCHNATVNLLNSGATDPALLNHEWTLPDGLLVNTGANATLNADQPGTYTLLVSNTQNGCTASDSASVAQHDNITVALTALQPVSCFGAADGAAAIAAGGGDGMFSYQWDNGATTPSVSNLSAGTYTVTVTDGENCSATQTIAVTQPDELIVNALANPPSAIGASDGAVAATPQGGTPPYFFVWDNGAFADVVTGLPAGFYTVTVTDANGCTAAQTVEVWGGECNLLADFQTVNPSCHGAADGQATALPIGGSAPYTYLWSSGSTEQTAPDLAAGTHSVTVIDVNGCAFEGTVSLDDPPPLTLSVEEVVHAVCANSAEGSVTVETEGGSGAVAVKWSNGQSGLTATGLAAGDYSATATDANGCTQTVAATVQASDQEPPSIQANNVIVPIGLSGQVELNMQNLGVSVSDNCAVASVQIAPDVFDCFNLGAQQVTISVQDISGNSSTQTITVTFVDTQAPVLECPASIIRCYGNNIVEYPAPVALDNCLVLGGTFALASGLPSGSPFPQGITTNTYTYADISGNMGTCSFQVTVLSPLQIHLDSLIHDTDNQNIGGIQVTVEGSMPGYSYQWTQNGQIFATSEDLGGIGIGLYTLQVTDAAGCTGEAGPFEVTSLVQTDDPDWTDRIALYPNPSTGLVFAVLPDELVNTDVDFVVFDATGRKVLEQKTSREKRPTLDLSGMADGLYFIVVRAERGYAVHKIVISR